MVRTWLGLLGIFLATAANAVTPSSPFTAVNSDGRPMTGATVTVTTGTGLPALTIWADAAGTVPYSNVVPSTGVVQFFAEPGAYVVTVAGSGVTRQFYLDIPTAGEGGLNEDSFGTNDGLLWKRGSNYWTTVKVELSSTRAPTVNDDLTQGYIPGSIWVDVIHGKIYMNTSEKDGAAEWPEVTGGSSSGGGNIASGTTMFQVPYWSGTQWIPGSALWTNGSAVAIGAQGIVDTTANLQLSRSTGTSPNIFLWNNSSNVVAGTELGEIDFGAVDSSSGPRKSAKIVARATGTWGTNVNDSATILDFRIQDGTDLDLLPFNALRLVGFAAPLGGYALGKIIVGGGIPDVPTITLPTALSTSGLDIYDTAGSKAISIMTPAGMASNRAWTLPNTNGSSGQALTTDGSSSNATLSWASFAPSLHAAQHSIGGIDETQSYDQIFDEGTLMPPRRILAFLGAGVTCVDSPTKTNCTIANTGGGSGITSLNSDTSASQTFVTGTTGGDFNIYGNGTGTHVFSLPDADFNVRGVVNTTTQTFTGKKSFLLGVGILAGLSVDGQTILNTSGGAYNFRVASDLNNNAIFVDGANNSVGIYTSTPDLMGLHPNTLAVAALTGKHGIFAQASTGSDAVHAISGSSSSAAVYGLAVAPGDSAILGEASNGNAHSAFFRRNTVGTIPMVEIVQQNESDSQPLLYLTKGNGVFQIAGSDGFGTRWGIDQQGQFMSAVTGNGYPAYSWRASGNEFSGTSGLYFTANDYWPGLTVNTEPGLQLEPVDQRQPNTLVFGRLLVHSNALPDIVSYTAEFSHAGGGNGVKIDNSTSLASTLGLYVIGGKDVVGANAARFDAQVGTAVDARQTGTFTGNPASSTAPIIKATREVVLSGGAALSGPLFLGVDSSNTTGRLLDLQRPANSSKFWVSNEGATGIDTGLSTTATPGLTVTGPNLQGIAGVRINSPAIPLEVRQTGATTIVGFDPAFKVRRNQTYPSGGISSGAMIYGVDDTTNGIGDLLVLEKPAGTPYFKISAAGELGFLGVALDGTGKVLCVKAAGDIGTCSTAVNATGVCTCA